MDMGGYTSCLLSFLIYFCTLGFAGSAADIYGGMLYPRESESRQIQSLDGMWDFRIDASPTRNEGFQQSWFSQKLAKTGPVLPMPVPSSYNDILPNSTYRDFVGWAWYERDFYVAQSWQSQRVVLRIDSAHYYSMVWVNGQPVMEHNGGHLPFEAVINKYAQFGAANRLTVAVNNTLTPTTLPPGTIKYQTDTQRFPPGYFVQNLQFDFFNYAGIHRSVRLYTTPQVYVDDITITTDIKGSTGKVNYQVVAGGTASSYKVRVLDKDGNSVGEASASSGTIQVPNAHLWWPYTMNTDFGYRYTLEVTVNSAAGDKDVYRQPFGIRTVAATNKQLLINGRPFYCHGVDKHEDSDIRGKGLDFALIARDFAMMKWLGVNCFRTSHYPYAEEILEQADTQGIAVIDESPGVGIQSRNMGNASLEHHLEVMSELVRRDKNKPAVIMWSMANEPQMGSSESYAYFKSVISHTRRLDPTRLITIVISYDYWDSPSAALLDVICINRYYGWYSDTGHTEVIQYQLPHDFQEWFKKYNKPMIMSEYGADTVPGLHTVPAFVFTEDYQTLFMKEYHKVFDALRSEFLVGELIWNFADFMTDQSPTRVVGNKKGILTRQRQPKMAAYLVRERYYSIINQTLPGFTPYTL